MLPDFDAEGVPLFRILDAGVAARANQSGGTCRYRESALIQREHRDLEALAGPADQVLLRHLDIVHLEPAGVAGEDAPFLLHRTRRESLEAALHHEGAEPAGIAQFLLL